MISPAANGWIWNRLSVASATNFDKVSAPPYSVSSDFGKLEVRRHLISGRDWAIAGLPTAVAARPATAALSTSRRFIAFLLSLVRGWAAQLFGGSACDSADESIKKKIIGGGHGDARDHRRASAPPVKKRSSRIRSRRLASPASRPKKRFPHSCSRALNFNT